MGADCTCVKNDKEEEYIIGKEQYTFKRIVCNIK